MERSLSFPKNLFITGNAGVGKSTLIKECTMKFRNNIGGFFTEEIREGSERIGFRLRTFDGNGGILAKKGMKSQNKMNKYGVDLSVLNSIGVVAIQDAIDQSDVVVVDEIGSMEMLSPLFSQTVSEAFLKANACLATIRLKAEPFSSQVKKMADSKLILLDRSNYDQVKKEVSSWLGQKVKR